VCACEQKILTASLTYLKVDGRDGSLSTWEGHNAALYAIVGNHNANLVLKRLVLSQVTLLSLDALSAHHCAGFRVPKSYEIANLETLFH